MSSRREAVLAKHLLVALWALAVLAVLPVAASEPPRPRDLDPILQELETYAQSIWDPAKVPGFAYAVVQGSETVYARGFGYRDKDASSGLVDERTLFEIGSCTKAFNAAVLGTVVDEGKVCWSDKATSQLPDFKMYDPWVTREFLVEDLMAQRSGMPGYSLDMMPLTGFSRGDIERAVRFVEPVTSFRSAYGYQNNLHLWVAELVEKKTGLAWEDAVQRRLLEPLGMSESTFDFATYDANPNHTLGHILQGDGSLWTIPPDWPYRRWMSIAAPAGGLCSNVADMAKWVSLQLGNGSYRGTVILKPETVQVIRTPRIYMGNVFGGVGSYAMGWLFQSSPQTPWYWHTGKSVGMHSIVTFLPECDLGLVVLTNTSANLIPECLAMRLLELCFGSEQHPCSAKALEEPFPVRRGDRESAAVPESAAAIPLSKCVGTYSNPAYGKVVIKKPVGGLTMAIGKTPVTGPLVQTAVNRFRFDWPDWPGTSSTVVFKADGTGSVVKLTVLELGDVRGGEFKRVNP